MVEHAGIETSNSTMEKLELLSATAALKQGIDGNNSSNSNSNGYSSSRSNGNHCGEKVLVLDNSNRVVDGNLPSPVSIEDNETETDDGTTATNVNIATKTNTLGENNSIHNNLGRTISRNSIRINPLVVRDDTRSPVRTTTVEYRQIDAVAAAAQSSPLPFPFLPRQTTHHNHHLNHHHQQQQQQHDYAPSSYIVRSLSEASPVYGGNNNSNNSIPISSSHHHAATAAATAAMMSTSAVTNNSSDYDTNLQLQQQQQQQQPPPPSHLRLSIQQQHHQQQQLRQHQRPLPQLSVAPSRSRSPTYEDMARQIQNMQEQLGEKDMVVSSLQHRVNYLENQIHELRQLPTGKISHIPVE